MDVNNLPNLAVVTWLYEQSKFWIALGSCLWMVFKGYDWIKSIRTKDLPNIQSGVDGLRKTVEEQTFSLVSELRELRQDFRTFFVPAQPIRARAKRQPRAKK